MILSHERPGEALNVDLNEFVNHLYAIIPFLGISSEAGDTGGDTIAKVRHAGKLTANASDWTAQAHMLFHVLHLIFTRNTAGGPPAWRTAAFAKRLLTAALHWDAETAARAVQFVTGLVRTNPKLEALLTTEDRSFDGVFQAEIDDPQLCHPFGTSFFELILLEKSHVDQGVRDAARALASNLSR
jgi:nucleolar complex protein 3